TKPFRLAELLARIRVRLRLTSPVEVVEVKGVRVDSTAHRVWRDEEEVELTPKEFGVLALLISDAGHVVSRQRLTHEVWDEDYYGSTRTLDMHVSSLRRKLHDDPSHPTRYHRSSSSIRSAERGPQAASEDGNDHLATSRVHGRAAARKSL